MYNARPTTHKINGKHTNHQFHAITLHNLKIKNVKNVGMPRYVHIMIITAIKHANIATKSSLKFLMISPIIYFLSLFV